MGLFVYGPAGADEMRFSNDGISWSAWQPYGAETNWSLAPSDGLRAVFSEVRDSATFYRSCDQIWRVGAGGSEVFVHGFECDSPLAWSAMTP